MGHPVAMETMRMGLAGISIEVPKEPPSPEDCPVQSRIECADGFWAIDVWKDGTCVSSHGPETFTTALFRALMKDNLGDVHPDEIVLRWMS
ncbi:MULTISPECIES: hypothetical protein [Aphanothece]|uniref:hypothetical protein n=1 Tax=Aphanothece TaxID=1121 RepID=UPI003984C9F8